MLKRLLLVSVFLIFIAMSLLIGLYFYYLQMLKPVDSKAAQKVRFQVESGEGVNQIVNRLYEQQFVQNKLAFKILLRFEHLAPKIQAGYFELSKDMSALEIAEALTSSQTDQIKVTIPEGLRREEVAELLDQRLDESFSKKEFLELTRDKEGYLFPETYLFMPDTTASDVVERLIQTFNTQVLEIQSAVEGSGKSLEDLLIMASLIEREAKTDRRLVSGILWNRIKLGMPLQVDATFQYAKGFDTSTSKWWSAPYAQDKLINSPYNTYQVVGLPPAPICSPSLNSLEAAALPETTNYLYYLTGNDGQMYYSVDYPGHLRNIALYLR